MKKCEFELPRTQYAFFARSGGLPTNRFPQTEEEANRADSLLAKSFEKLSVQDREKVLHDIHAVAELPEEHPKLVEQKLSQLLRELNEIINNNSCTYAYARVLVERNGCMLSPKFYRMFLCREGYDVTRAAMAILQHFEVKRKWFGEGEVLTRPVYQSDLTEQEKMILEMGFMRLWSERDSSGRTILSFEDRQVTGIPFPFGHGHYRVMWYMMMKALEDQGTRARGVIFVVPIPSENPDKLNIAQANDFNEIKAVIPVAIVAQHICYQHSWQRPYLTGIKMFTNDAERFRMQIHHGCKDDIEKKLQTFGIPTRRLLWKKESAPQHIKAHQEWLTEQWAVEMSQIRQLGYSEKQEVEADSFEQDAEEIKPNRFDVLFGRTVFTRGHTGTLRAMHIVQMKYDAYEQLGRYQKMAMAEKIVREIQQSGGRFLRQNEDDLWLEVDDAEARKKIAHWFRRRREDLQSKKRDQTNSSDTTRRTRRCRLVPENP